MSTISKPSPWTVCSINSFIRCTLLFATDALLHRAHHKKMGRRAHSCQIRTNRIRTLTAGHACDQQSLADYQCAEKTTKWSVQTGRKPWRTGSRNSTARRPSSGLHASPGLCADVSKHTSAQAIKNYSAEPAKSRRFVSREQRSGCVNPPSRRSSSGQAWTCARHCRCRGACGSDFLRNFPSYCRSPRLRLPPPEPRFAPLRLPLPLPLALPRR